MSAFQFLTVDVFDSMMATVEYNNPQLTAQNLGIPSINQMTIDEFNFMDYIQRYGKYNSNGQYTVTLKYPAGSTLASMNKFVNVQVPAYNALSSICFKLILVPG